MKRKYLPIGKASIKAMPRIIGITASIFAAGSAAAVEANYQYYRFVVLESQDGNGRLLAQPPPASPNLDLQVAEFTFYHQGQKLNLNGNLPFGQAVAVEVYTGSTPDLNAPPETEDFEAEWGVVDNDLTTKWLNYGGENGGFMPLVFKFASPVAVDSYNFASANDASGRTPRSWRFEGSNDGVNYTLLDQRLSYGPFGDRSNYSYQHGAAFLPGFSLPDPEVLASTTPSIGIDIFDVVEGSSIVAPGDDVMFAWQATAGATVTLEPGGTTLVPDAGGNFGNFTVNPTETTTYTIKAKSGTQTVARSVTVRVVDAGSKQYRYVRFTPLISRGWSASATQVADFKFYNGDTLLTVASATNPGGRTPAAEGPGSLIDGDSATKWLDFNRRGVIFDFGSVTQFDSYELVTANDADVRDPVAWLMEGRNSDTGAWEIVDHVGRGGQYYPMPTLRLTPTGKIKLPSTSPIVWQGSGEVAAWNSFGSQTFTDGDWVVLDDSSQAPIVNTVGNFKPGGVIFNNSTKRYTSVGVGLNGPGALLKRGSGELEIASPTALTGPVQIESGKLILSAPDALGRADAIQPLFMEPGTELSVTASQWSQRPLILTGSTINVAEEVEFSHVGPLKLDQTVRKTGPGTLKLFAYQNSQNSGRANHQFIVEDGRVEFSTDLFNRSFFGSRAFFATARGNGTIAGTVSGALGGDYVEYQVAIGQLRAEDGGTIATGEGGIQYLPVGLVDTNGVQQGRIVLRNGNLMLTGQTETSRAGEAVIPPNGTLPAPDGTSATRTVISTEASADSSHINGTSSLVLNPAFIVFDVADGAIHDDLLVHVNVTGARGVIKQGAGNMVLLGNNSYAGNFVNGPHNPEDPRYGTVVETGRLTASNIRIPGTTDSATGEHPVQIQAPATLSGLGFITGSVELAGTVEVGDTGIGLPFGALTVGSTTLTGTYRWKVNGPAVEFEWGDGDTAGADLLIVEGNLNLTGSTLQVVPSGAGFVDASYVIATYTGTRTGSFANVPVGYEVTYDDANKQILITSDGTQPPDPEGYEEWIAGTDLTGDDALPGSDPDGDGLSNLIEFVLGTDPEASDTSDVPTIARDGEGNLVFTFRRTTASAYLNPAVEYSTSLAPNEWTTAAAATVSVEANGFGQGIDRVTVTLPASLASGGKLFARLAATL